MSTELINYYNLTVEEVKAEVALLTVEKIRHFPCTPSNRDSFYELWNRFGPEAARTAMIPYVWQGKVPLPSEFYGKKRATAVQTNVQTTSES